MAAAHHYTAGPIDETLAAKKPPAAPRDIERLIVDTRALLFPLPRNERILEALFRSRPTRPRRFYPARPNGRTIAKVARFVQNFNYCQDGIGQI